LKRKTNIHSPLSSYQAPPPPPPPDEPPPLLPDPDPGAVDDDDMALLRELPTESAKPLMRKLSQVDPAYQRG
jgi:hypothetical protein